MMTGFSSFLELYNFSSLDVSRTKWNSNPMVYDYILVDFSASSQPPFLPIFSAFLFATPPSRLRGGTDIRVIYV